MVLFWPSHRKCVVNYFCAAFKNNLGKISLLRKTPQSTASVPYMEYSFSSEEEFFLWFFLRPEIFYFPSFFFFFFSNCGGSYSFSKGAAKKNLTLCRAFFFRPEKSRLWMMLWESQEKMKTWFFKFSSGKLGCKVFMAYMFMQKTAIF